MDSKTNYLASDIEYTLDLFRTYIAFIEKNWNNIPGRPTVVFLITKDLYRKLEKKTKFYRYICSNSKLFFLSFHHSLKTEAHEIIDSQLISTIKKLYSGYINGARLEI